MILLVKTNADALHDREFVHPIRRIVEGAGREAAVKHYLDVSDGDLQAATHAFICGTALADDAFATDVERFAWLRSFEKPVLGICAGMQLLGLLFGGKLEKKPEIGYWREDLAGFLGAGEHEVYHLHGKAVDFSGLPFTLFGSQAVRHKERPFFGVLFHPEVRCEDLVRSFLEQ